MNALNVNKHEFDYRKQSRSYTRPSVQLEQEIQVFHTYSSHK